MSERSERIKGTGRMSRISPRARTAGLLGPALVLLLVATAWPLGRAVHSSLYNYPFTNPDARTFVGLDNYANVVANADWWQSIVWALAIMVIVVAVQLMLGFLFAQVLFHLIRIAPIAHILLLLPFAALSFVAAFSWNQAFSGGFINEWFRFDSSGDRGDVIAICLSEIWRGTGLVAIILLVGLSRVPASLMDSAVADGATARQRFTRIVMPAIAPAAAIAIAYRALDAFRMFDGPYVVARPDSTIQAPQLWTFDTSINDFELGLGATMSVLFFLIAAVLGVGLVRSLRIRRVV